MRPSIAEPRIFLGHGLDAVEPGIAIADIVEARFGERQSKAPAPVSGIDDIEAAKCEVVVVDGHRHARDRAAVKHAHEEAVGIDRVETGGVAQPRVPAFRGGPVDDRLDARKRHSLYAVIALRLAHSVAAYACGLSA